VLLILHNIFNSLHNSHVFSNYFSVYLVSKKESLVKKCGLLAAAAAGGR
jgi:hypothetical protein